MKILSKKLPNILAIIVLAIGSTQMIGYLTGIRALRGIGLASGISPFPKVFCEADGYEAFAASFALKGTLADGRSWSCQLDPETYARIHGPYNRRNVYGAALAFTPRLPENLRKSLISRALAPGSALRHELSIPDGLVDVEIHIQPRSGTPHGPWICDENGNLSEL